MGANIFDMASAGVFAFFTVRGAMRGFTGEVVSLLGLIVSVVCGWTLAAPLADIVLKYFPTWDLTITELISAIAIFMAVSLAFASLGKMLKALVKAANLSFLNHVVGAAAGAGRAFALVLLVYGVISVFPAIAESDWVRDSLAMEAAAFVWPAVVGFLTENGWIDTSRLTPDSLPGIGAPALFPQQ